MSRVFFECHKRKIVAVLQTDNDKSVVVVRISWSTGEGVVLNAVSGFSELPS